MHQSDLRRARALVARRCHRADQRRRALPVLRRHAAKCAATSGTALSDAPASPDRSPAPPPPPSLTLRITRSRIAQPVIGRELSVSRRPLFDDERDGSFPAARESEAHHAREFDTRYLNKTHSSGAGWFVRFRSALCRCLPHGRTTDVSGHRAIESLRTIGGNMGSTPAEPQYCLLRFRGLRLLPGEFGFSERTTPIVHILFRSRRHRPPRSGFHSSGLLRRFPDAKPNRTETAARCRAGVPRYELR
jgi:hypothetical protein